MASTPRLALPMLASGQAQKEITHNEALLILDALTQSVSSAGPSNATPPAPIVGEVYLCGNAPTGAWLDQADSLALYTANGWRFVPAFEGLTVFDRLSGLNWQYRGGTWLAGICNVSAIKVAGKKVVGTQEAGISGPAGGSVVDEEARAVIGQILSALRSHGLIAS